VFSVDLRLVETLLYRVFFATDIHGSNSCFTKFLTALQFYRSDALILGGDVTGKQIVPIIRQENGGEHGYRFHFLGEDKEITSDEELQRTEKLCRDVGAYPFVTTRKELDELERDAAKMDQKWVELATLALKKWEEEASQKLRNTGKEMYVTGGNDDRPEIFSVLKDSKSMMYVEDTVTEVGSQYEMISLGYSNPTPWKTPRECSEQELTGRIESLVSKVKEVNSSIFNIHVPPIGLGIDIAPELDEKTMQIKTSTKAVGSTAVREEILKYQPLLGLHGHVHESRGALYLKRTFCVNPGSEYSEGILRGAVINIEGKNKVKGHLLTSA
jgi:Icc-related predicted phosphoesterase